MDISNIIKKENIFLDLDLQEREDIIRELCHQMEINKCVNNANLFIADVMEREKMISTKIGNGIAIPHGKSTQVFESTVAFARLKNPVSWDGSDEDLVSLVFLLAVQDSEDHASEHLKMLASLSCELMNDDFVKKLKGSETLDEIYEVIIGKGGEE